MTACPVDINTGDLVRRLRAEQASPAPNALWDADAEAAEVAQRESDWYVSANRTCELGMQAATGKAYRHVLELLEAVTR